MRDFEAQPDCAVEHCFKPMTDFDIYCEGHDYLTTIERIHYDV